MADYKKYDKYDTANPHTRYIDTDPVTTKVYLDMMKDPKQRESYLNELDTYDAKQRAIQKETKKAAPMGAGMPALKPKAKPAAADEDYMPADIKDKLQDKKNKKAAENYEATKEYKKGGSVGSASSRADGCAQRGKTRGKMV
jgi:hypothetical protein